MLNSINYYCEQPLVRLEACSRESKVADERVYHSRHGPLLKAQMGGQSPTHMTTSDNVIPSSFASWTSVVLHLAASQQQPSPLM